MTTNPVRDAEDHEDRRQTSADTQDFIESRLRQIFTQDVMHVSALSMLRVPYPDAIDGGAFPVTVAAAMLDELEHSDVEQALLNVIRTSQCPAVAALREAIASRYIAAVAHRLQPADFNFE